MLQELFLRRSFQPETITGANFLLGSFANYFLEDLFETAHNTSGAERLYGYRRLAMSQLYGATLERQQALRTLQVGLAHTLSHVAARPLLV